MFVTCELISGGAPRIFQFSDANLTLKMLHNIVGMALRRLDSMNDRKIEYCDEDGDWIVVASDRDVAEFFAVAAAMKPKLVQVR
jgi:hypothetical protein